MDSTAISMCMDNRLPIVVFNLRKPGNIKRAIMGDPIGTWVGAASSGVSEPLEKLT
jgi:uridylate kinase